MDPTVVRMGLKNVSPPRKSASPSRIGKFELGRTLGEGTFAKVRFARNVETGEHVAVKVLDKEKILKHRMVEQIKREISTMKMVKHPNIVQLHEVLASKTKIYLVLEFVEGGELFGKIVKHGRLKESYARRYFQQLINAVDYCHSLGVYHRDLKPENLLLDSNGNLKVSDFGLSALPQQFRADGLLHTTCGTPNYVAPEVISNKGYDGAPADLWSCGVILYVLMAGFLPFEDSNIMNLYRKIFRAEFKVPSWFSPGVRKLLAQLLHPNPKKRITIPQILENEWFKKDYKPAKLHHEEDVVVGDVESVFNESGEHTGAGSSTKPGLINAFELISMSSGLDLSGLFEKQQEPVKQETRFTSMHSAKEIISKIEETAKPLGLDVQQKQNFKMKLRKSSSLGKSFLSISTEVFEVSPELYMVELRKSEGDTLEYRTFYKSLSSSLKDIIWSSDDDLLAT
ncbi:CBL-interacting protein kinase 32 [Selaginella moellendorffii]|nr:CBL-interacting protein kinase 32 [Selaginella moellendorffii]|eukprot:XP_002963272.2 CBL-interacting protein kinase 32 [Selaginella moellendorffii]